MLEVSEADIEPWRETVLNYSLFRGDVVAFSYIEYYEKLARARGIENYTQYAVTFGLPSGARVRRASHLS